MPVSSATSRREDVFLDVVGAAAVAFVVAVIDGDDLQTPHARRCAAIADRFENRWASSFTDGLRSSRFEATRSNCPNRVADNPPKFDGDTVVEAQILG